LKVDLVSLQFFVAQNYGCLQKYHLVVF